MAQSNVIINQTDEKWHTSLVTRYLGPIASVRNYIPSFERYPFGRNLLSARQKGASLQTTGSGVPLGLNPLYDTIVRIPHNNEEPDTPLIPVGIVSPKYVLLQHQELVDEVINVITKLGIDPARVKAEMDLTQYGERMRLGLIFPREYNINIREKDKMGLRLECFNSVDGSMKFMAVIGWLRFVCSNGLIIGVAKTDCRRRHNQGMEINEIIEVLRDGIAAATKEKKAYTEWMNHKIAETDLRCWVDGFLAKKWGVKAAARTWHITQTGHDVVLDKPFEKGAPTEKSVCVGDKVPGTILPGDTAYAVAQTLAWLAKERRDLQEQLEWKQQILGLMQPLLEKRVART